MRHTCLASMHPKVRELMAPFAVAGHVHVAGGREGRDGKRQVFADHQAISVCIIPSYGTCVPFGAYFIKLYILCYLIHHYVSLYVHIYPNRSINVATYPYMTLDPKPYNLKPKPQGPTTPCISSPYDDCQY